MLWNLAFATSASSSIHYEDATLDQAEFLTNLAMDSNGTYGYRTVPDETAIKVFEVKEENFKHGIVRIMKSESEIIGFFGLMKVGRGSKKINVLTHLFLKPEYIGKGFGKELFREAMRTAYAELHWEALVWDSDPNAAWFYNKMGAKKVGESLNPLNPTQISPTFIYVLGDQK